MLLPVGLMMLALLLAVIGAIFYDSSHEIIVPINRTALEEKINQEPVSASAPMVASAERVRSIALKPAPDPRLIEVTPFGLLPRKAINGDKPFDIYSRPPDQPTGNSNLPKLSIVLIRSGISESLTTEASVVLPPEVSLSISPYATDVERQIRDIRNRGHEIFLDVVSKATDSYRDDRGPHALDLLEKQGDRRERLLWMMSRFTGYAGLIGDIQEIDGRPTSLPSIIIQETRTRGLAYLELPQSRHSAAAVEPEASNESSLQLPVVVLAGERPDDLAEALKGLDAKFKKDTKLIAVIDIGPLALDSLKGWLTKHMSSEFDLVPLSVLMRKEGQG